MEVALNFFFFFFFESIFCGNVIFRENGIVSAGKNGGERIHVVRLKGLGFTGKGRTNVTVDRKSTAAIDAGKWRVFFSHEAPIHHFIYTSVDLNNKILTFLRRIIK